MVSDQGVLVLLCIYPSDLMVKKIAVIHRISGTREPLSLIKKKEKANYNGIVSITMKGNHKS